MFPGLSRNIIVYWDLKKNYKAIIIFLSPFKDLSYIDTQKQFISDNCSAQKRVNVLVNMLLKMGFF